MISLAQTKLKAENDARLSEEKKISERQRNIIVLIERHLLNCGYIEAANKLQTESTVSLDKWDAADNVDLYMIVCEFEQFYEMKYGRPPKLVKKMLGGGDDRKLNLPKVMEKKGSIVGKSSSADPPTNAETQQPSKPPLMGSKNKKISQGPPSSSSKAGQMTPTENGAQGEAPTFEVAGNAITKQGEKKKEEKEEDFFDIKVLKGLPDYSNNPELRELALTLQRDICVENPNVTFEDIVGLDDAKRLLKEAVLLPLKYPQLFRGILEPWNGVLLFGPPGTGKTMLAKAVATECKTTFFNISASSIVSKWRGESEKLVRVLFELARHYQPSTIFIDEIDSLMSQRGDQGAEHEGSRRMKTELLIQMDGLIKKKERVFVLAASNLPWDLDIALLRRLEKRILVPLPEPKAREVMIRKFLPDDMADNLDYEQYGNITQGYSGSDLKLLCKESAMKPLRRLLQQLESIKTNPTLANKKGMPNLRELEAPDTDVKPEPVLPQDFMEALDKTKPSPVLHHERYRKWEHEFGSL